MADIKYVKELLSQGPSTLQLFAPGAHAPGENRSAATFTNGWELFLRWELQVFPTLPATQGARIKRDLAECNLICNTYKLFILYYI